MSSGERPIGAAKGKQSDTEALCQPPPPPSCLRTSGYTFLHVNAFPWVEGCTLKVRKTTVRRVPVLRQGRAHEQGQPTSKAQALLLLEVRFQTRQLGPPVLSARKAEGVGTRASSQHQNTHTGSYYCTPTSDHNPGVPAETTKSGQESNHPEERLLDPVQARRPHTLPPLFGGCSRSRPPGMIFDVQPLVKSLFCPIKRSPNGFFDSEACIP